MAQRSAWGTVLEISQDNITAVANLSIAADAFDRNLAQLLDGNPKKEIPAASGPLRDKLLQVQSSWKPVAEAIDIISLNSNDVADIASSVDVVVANSDLLLAQSEKVIAVLEKEARAKTNRILIFLQGLGLFFLVVFLAAAWIIRQSMKPMQQMIALGASVADVDLPDLRHALGRLADGDLTTQVSVVSTQVIHTSSDEMGQMAVIFNSIVDRPRGRGQPRPN